MIHHGIHAALARERMSTFLAQAEADRLARQARRQARGRKVWLRDGSAVLIRPVRPADAGLLADGFARYVRDRDDPRTAEIAVTVIDDWQGRGLGTELLTRLSERACQEGIRRFTAAVAADNAATAGLLRTFGGDLVRREFGTLEYEMDLACGPAGWS